MKLPPIIGKVFEVRKVETVRKGFNQVVIIHQEEQRNNQGYLLSKEQFYVIQIYSNKKDDSRFLPAGNPDYIGAECTALVYMDAHRYKIGNDFTYNNRLNLDKWEH